MTLIACLVRSPSSSATPGALEAVARACSPRVVPWRDDAAVFDASGLDRAIGSPARIAAEVTRLSAERGLQVRVGLAGKTTTAWLLAHVQPGISIAMPGREADALSPLPIEALKVMAVGPMAPIGLRFAPDLECLEILRRWGLSTLGDLARLARGDLHARLGPDGVRLHQVASGEDECPLAPVDEGVRYRERCELEWPIDGLEPLAFVVARLCELLEGRLERADRGAIAVTTRLRLVARTSHERTLHVPAPMREARVLRTLILLDLESHPPDAAIDIVEIDLDVAPGNVVAGSLFDLTLPLPEDLATLVARLGALMGETRIGAPVLVETFDARTRAIKAFDAIKPIKPTKAGDAFTVKPGPEPTRPHPAPGWSLRRLPLPVAAKVMVEQGRPVRVTSSARGLPGGPVKHCAGPWRSSGAWWTLDRRAWDRDEWDVELPDGVYRLARDRATGAWSIDAIVD
jgi:protein ImuB